MNAADQRRQIEQAYSRWRSQSTTEAEISFAAEFEEGAPESAACGFYGGWLAAAELLQPEHETECPGLYCPMYGEEHRHWRTL